MKFFIFIFSQFFYFCCLELFHKENGIYILTNKNFDNFISQYESTLIVFHAPWCGYCKKLIPELENIASILSKENIILGKIDATSEKNLSYTYKIKNYPTIYFFKNKNPIIYTGARKEKEIINWLRKKNLPSPKQLNSITELEKFKNENELGIIYFGENKEDLKIFNYISLKNDNIPFGIFNDQLIASKYNIKERSVVLFKKFDEGRNDLKIINELELQNCIEKYSKKRIKYFDEKTTSLIFIRNNPAIVYFGKKGEIWEKDEKIMQKISQKVESKLIVVMTEIEGGLGKRVAERVGVKENNLPCISIIENKIDTIKYIMEGDIEESNILNFIKKWGKRELNKHLKSQKEPKENNDIIFILVGKAYKKEVIDNDKDVMVLFYSPISSESMKLLSIFEKVAKKIKKKNPNIIFAKIDGNENDVDSVIIYGLPTIIFYPGNKKNKSPITYRGDKNTDSIIEFIQKHASNIIVLTEGIIADL